jgi:hypothetical protein
MSFFFDGPEWLKLTNDAARSFLLRLNAQMVSPEEGGGPGPFVFRPASRETEHVDSGLPVTEVSRRRLTFYPEGWNAYRVACAIDDVMELSGYQTRAFAFAVCGPERVAESCTLIDWKSAPLHRLNELVGLDLSRLDSDQVREYLMFFCTFIGGEQGSSGAIAPFFLPNHASVFAWDETLEDFETLARRRRLEMFAPMDDPNRADDFDLPETAKTLGSTSPGDKPIGPAPGDQEAAQRAVAGAFAAYPGTPRFLPSTSPAEAAGDTVALVGNDQAPEADSQSAAARPASSPQWTAQYEGLVWYGASLFMAKFSLERLGGVEMLSDEPVSGATALPMPRWEVQRGPGDVWLLCRQLKREALTTTELLERIKIDIKQSSAISGHAVARVRLRGLRVQDRFERAIVFKGPVRLLDIEFTHDVVLDDSIFERSLELLDCRFLQRLSGRDVTVKGALRLDGSHIDGAVAQGASSAKKRQPPVLDLRGLIVERGLFVDRLTVFGRLRGEWIRVGGTVRARGMQIHPRNADLDGDSAVDLSHARIDGPLDLAGYVAKQREPGGRRRTLLGGNAKLGGLICAQADLNGIRVRGSLDLSSCLVKERLRVSVTPVDSERDTWWRARIDREFILDRSQVGRIEMQGCQTDRNFNARELQLSGSLFAGLAGDRTLGRFRTLVGGDFIGSGANIRGDLELDGARVGGQIVFMTGHLGRLRANVNAWATVDPSSGRWASHLCASEVEGVILQDVSVAASIQLIGIQLRQSSERYGAGSLFAHAVRLGAGLRFWRGEVSVELLRQALLGLAPTDGLTDDDRTHAAKRLDKLIEGVSASIPGTLDLSEIRTGDATNLSRLSVGGAVNLSNARIEGDLFASFEAGRRSSSANGFNADMAHVGGDVDVRGLLIGNKDFSARDADVTGQLLFATAPARTLTSTGNSADGGHALVSAGRLDLEGARAARIVVSSANIATEVSGGDRKAAIALSRGRFGQLTVLGFEHYASRRPPSRFPCSIDLSAINVGDWDINPDTESLALLEATAPRWFDARNFVEIEQRLAKIGSKDKADQVYRRMRRLGARTRVARFTNRLNGGFSGNGTRPALMLLWLIVAMLPVIYVLKNPVNVEFPGGTTVDGKDARPVSDGRHYDLDADWGVVKATELASTYALPFLGAKPDVVRARLIGDTCIDYLVSWPAPRPPTSPSHTAGQGPVPQAAGDSARCSHGFTFPIPPHAIAMIFSTVQFFLWVSVAANLPVIARRRP